MRRIASLVVAASLGGCLLPSPAVSPNGRPATVHLQRNLRIAGELIAVSPDTVWMWTANALTAYATPDVLRLDVQRHPMGGIRTFKWMALAGMGTGVSLMISCAQVDDADCAAVLPSVALTFGLLGGAFGLLNYSSAWHRFEPAMVAGARPFARFPQGMPDTLRKPRLTLSP